MSEFPEIAEPSEPSEMNDKTMEGPVKISAAGFEALFSMVNKS